jgi:hypothetical protein
VVVALADEALAIGPAYPLTAHAEVQLVGNFKILQDCRTNKQQLEEWPIAPPNSARECAQGDEQMQNRVGDVIPSDQEVQGS